MTESEWLASMDPVRMLDLAAGRICPRDRVGNFSVSDRRLRLFADAVRHQFYHDHLVSRGMWSGWESNSHMDSRLRDEALSAVRAAVLWASECSMREWKASLLRDIVGNPWEPVTLCGDSRCNQYLCATANRLRTPTVRALAEVAYAERADNGTLDLGHLAILADALEDAGSENAKLLTHLRASIETVPCTACLETREQYAEEAASAGVFLKCNAACPGYTVRPAVHVRGYWALDLILGNG